MDQSNTPPKTLAADTLRIEGLQVHCVVGILPHERRTRQSLEIAVEIDFDATAAATTGQLQCSIDYDTLAKRISFVLVNARFRLIESAALALCHLVLDCCCGNASAVAVTIRKPDALGGNGVPSVTVKRSHPDGKPRVPQRSSEVFRCPEAAIQWVDADNPVAGPDGFHSPADLTCELPERILLRVWSKEP